MLKFEVDRREVVEARTVGRVEVVVVAVPALRVKDGLEG